MTEKIERHLIAKSVFKTGNPWIDDCLAGGLNKENLLLVAAKTGVGKTFFGVQLASFAARAGKSVHYFALEAEKHEIERRRLYYAISRLVYSHYKSITMPRYREWLHQEESPDWNAIELEAQCEIDKNECMLTTTYANGVYTPDNFKSDVLDLINSETDKPELIILDHLHHFFLSGDEIDALKSTIHQIKKLKDDIEVPIVILSQLRKNDGSFGSKRSLPKIEDIRGTAALSDVATDVLIISAVPTEKKVEIPGHINFPMYFHLAKSRTAAEAKNLCGIVGFDFSTGTYTNKYIPCEVLPYEDPKLILSSTCPKWAKNAIFPVSILPNVHAPNKRHYGGFDDED